MTLAAAMIFSIFAFSINSVFAFAGDPVKDTETITIEGVSYPYIQQFSDEEELSEKEMKFYYVNSGDIPYAVLSEFMPFLSELLAELEYGDIENTIIKLGEQRHFSGYQTGQLQHDDR